MSLKFYQIMTVVTLLYVSKFLTMTKRKIERIKTAEMKLIINVARIEMQTTAAQSCKRRITY